MRRTRVGAMLTAMLIAASIISVPAAHADEIVRAAPADASPPALPQWSGSVLGGTEIALPGRSRTISFASIHPGSNFTLGLDTDGNAWSWGINGFGQLGNSEYIGRFVFAPYPVAVLDATGVQMRAKDMTASGNFSVVVDESGKTWSYGRNNFGQLGNPSIPTGSAITGSVTPVPVVDAAGAQMTFDRVSSGTNFAFGLDSEGRAWSWGRNFYGQLGGVSNSNVFITPVSTVATPVLDAEGRQMRFASIDGGEDFAIGIDMDGHAWGWGNNSTGQLGSDGPTTDRPRPILDDRGQQHSFTTVSAGYDTAVALDAGGRAWTWGAADSGALGNPSITTRTRIPVEVLDDAGEPMIFTSVSTWDSTVFGRDANGHIWGWGANSNGQLGRQPDEVPASVVPVELFDEAGGPLIADQVYAGSSHATMIGAFDPAVHTNAFAWGAAWYGQLGNPDVDTSQDAFTPWAVPIALPQPSTESIVYFGDDDTVGVRGSIVDGELVVNAPRHLAGRVPVYVAWFGDEPTRDHVGYFTFLLDPALAVLPSRTSIGTTADVVVTVPAAEVPLIGDAVFRFAFSDPRLAVAGAADPSAAPFDSSGVAKIAVTSDEPATYPVSGVAVVDRPGDPITHDVVVSSELTGQVTFEADIIVTPPATSKFGSVTLHKVDGDGDPLPGARFKVIYSHLAKPDFDITTDADVGVRDTGFVCDMRTDSTSSCTIRVRYSDWSQSTQLLPGDDRWNYYWLVETDAPDGYELLAERIPFQVTRELVDADHNIPDITIANVRSRGMLLPFTGGMGAWMYLALGGGLLTGAVLVMILRRRTHSRNDDTAHA